MKGWFYEPYRHSLAARGHKMNLRLSDNETIKILRTSAVEQALTPRMENILLSTKDSAELNELMLKHEKEMAEKRNEYWGKKFFCEYLVCDEAVEIMSYILKRKSIEHESIVGFSDTGDSHVWLRVNGYNYDPTEQGMHEGQIVEKWNPVTGNKIFDYADPDRDEEKYWNSIDILDGQEENNTLDSANQLYDEARSNPNLCGGSEVKHGYWIESHTIGCRNAADEHLDDWWENHYKIYDEYRKDGISKVIGDPETGVFVTVTPLDGKEENGRLVR